MRFSYLANAVVHLASLVAASALMKRQGAAQLAKLSGWIEMTSVRPNGHLLLTLLDAPDLWSLDPSTKKASKILSFTTGALGLMGITEVSPDVFVAVTGNFNTKTYDLGAGSYAVYKVDLSGSMPTSTLIKKVTESGFLLGVTPLNNDTIFIADAGKGAIYTMSISTGEYKVAMQDAKMKAPASAFVQEGIHGIKYHDGYIYFTNTFGNTFNKIKVDADGKVTGAITPINTSLQGPEDFVITADGTAYVATMNGGGIFKVTPDGKATRFAAAAQCSTCAFGRTDKDDKTLYFSTSQGSVLSAEVS